MLSLIFMAAAAIVLIVLGEQNYIISSMLMVAAWTSEVINSYMTIKQLKKLQEKLNGTATS